METILTPEEAAEFQEKLTERKHKRWSAVDQQLAEMKSKFIRCRARWLAKREATQKFIQYRKPKMIRRQNIADHQTELLERWKANRDVIAKRIQMRARQLRRWKDEIERGTTNHDEILKRIQTWAPRLERWKVDLEKIDVRITKLTEKNCKLNWKLGDEAAFIKRLERAEHEEMMAAEERKKNSPMPAIFAAIDRNVEKCLNHQSA